MSTHSISTLPRLSATALSEILLSHSKTSLSSNLDAQSAPAHIAIIDVRDDDHIGGHIRHSTHVPSQSLAIKIPELVRKLADKDIVVFHCALSQQRGPGAALRYLRERERLLPGTTAELMKENKGDELKKGAGDGEWEDLDEGSGKKNEQMVYVLDRGFVGWQEMFGEDVRLTEGYRKEIWRDGYWM